MTLNLYALHGFLGTPDDWKILEDLPHSAVDLFKHAGAGLEEWAEQFNSSVHTQGNVLIGYSLGARLALHALVLEPAKWQAAVIVSGHSGFDNEADRARRRERDLGRALKFANEPWDQLMQDWEAQPLFLKQIFQRNESQFDRTALSSALTHWSMSMQNNLKGQIEALNIPILWIAGEHDPDYRKHAETMHFFHPSSRVWIAENAGHRVPWDLPTEFLINLREFLSC